MPLYDYYCKDCNKKVETLEPIGTDPLICECGKSMERLIGAPRLVFKGKPTDLGNGRVGFNTGFSALDSQSDDIVDTTPPDEVGSVMK
jgi:putative FmdB family regulatory protein